MTTELMPRIVSEANLHNAWQRVRANNGGPGLDAVALPQFERSLQANLADLRSRLLDGTYLPYAYRRVAIPKRNGGMRNLAIPAVADRVAQRAFANVLDPLIDPGFLDCSYAYRTGRSVDMAVRALLRHREEGYRWMLDADIERCFDTLDHDLLMRALRVTISDAAVLRTVRIWLEAGSVLAEPKPPPVQGLLDRAGTYLSEVGAATLDDVLGRSGSAPVQAGAWDEEYVPRPEEMEPPARSRLVGLGRDALLFGFSLRHLVKPLLMRRIVTIGGGVGVAAAGVYLAHRFVRDRMRRPSRRIGAPQGSPLSPLLANVYLHAFDTAMQREGLRLVRYADDFVVCCLSRERAEYARLASAQALGSLRLRLHPVKTRIVDCGSPLEFLGHRFDRDGAFPVPPTRGSGALSEFLESWKQGERPWYRNGVRNDGPDHEKEE